MEAKEKEEFFHCFPVAGTAQQLPGKQNVCVPVVWEDKLHSYKCPCILHLTSALLPSMSPYSTEKPFRSVVTCSHCVLSQPLTHSQFTDLWKGWGWT